MKKKMENYVLNIPCTNNAEAKEGLQKAFDASGLYPWKLSGTSKGICASVICPMSCPTYKFNDRIIGLSARIKEYLLIASVTLMRNPVTVDTDNFPADIKDIMSKSTNGASKEETEMLIKIREDESNFHTHTTKQFLATDYDDKANRKAELLAIRAIRNAAKAKTCGKKQQKENEVPDSSTAVATVIVTYPIIEERYPKEKRSKRCKSNSFIDGQLAFDLSQA